MARVPLNSFASVIAAYFNSVKFSSLAHSTQVGYRQYLKLAADPEVLGAMPVGVIRPAIVQQFLDGLAHTPGAQQRARGALKAVERWALVRDLLPFPITTGTETVKGGDGHRPWLDGQVAIAERYARPDLARVITLAANTGQRGSDLFRMRWSDIEVVNGRPGINVIQRKTGLQLWIPMTEPLMAAIDRWEKRPAPLLLKQNGEPWDSRHQLSEAWTRERDRNPNLASCAGLVLHGLRATAIIRLRRAGATAPQISDMIGLSVPMIERYCRFASQKDSALAAVHMLDMTVTRKSKAEGE